MSSKIQILVKTKIATVSALVVLLIVIFDITDLRWKIPLAVGYFVVFYSLYQGRRIGLYLGMLVFIISSVVFGLLAFFEAYEFCIPTFGHCYFGDLTKIGFWKTDILLSFTNFVAFLFLLLDCKKYFGAADKAKAAR